MSTSVQSAQSSQATSASTPTIASNVLEKMKSLALFSGGLGFIPTGLFSLAGTISPLFILIPLVVGMSGAACHLLAKQMLFKKCNQLIESAQADLSAGNVTSAKKAIELLEFFLKNVHPETLNENEHQKLSKKLTLLNMTYETSAKTVQKAPPENLERSEAAARSEALISAEADRYVLTQRQKADASMELATGLQRAIKRNERPTEEIDVDDLISQMSATLTAHGKTQNNQRVQAQSEAAYQQQRQVKSRQIQASVNADSGTDFQAYYTALDPNVRDQLALPRSVPATATAAPAPSAPKKPAPAAKTPEAQPKVQSVVQASKPSAAREVLSFVSDVLQDFIGR